MSTRSQPFLLMLAFWFVGSSPLQGQTAFDLGSGSHWLTGYVANAPQQLLGFGAMIPAPVAGPWALYLDGKLTTDSPANDVFDPSLTPSGAEALGDEFSRERSAWTTLNVGVARGLTRELAVYLGSGISWQTSYLQYLDTTGERGEFGRYWVEDPDESRVRPNVLAGAFFRMSNWIAFQFGAEAAPAGVTAGLHLRVR